MGRAYPASAAWPVPGIVHRLDKNTSGVMVAAKTDAAHRGLSALFAAHDIDRLYVALTRGAPKLARGDVVTRIGRSPTDRKKMAVLRSGGREAITHYEVTETFGSGERPRRGADRLQARDRAHPSDTRAPRPQGGSVPG